MRKLPFVCLLLVLSVILLCGCGQSFTYTFYVDGAGAVHQEIRFEYDADAESADIVKAEAERIVAELIIRNDWSEVAEVDSDTEGVVELRVVYPSVTDYYIALGYTGKEENELPDSETHGLLTAYSTSQSFYSDDFETKARALLGEGYETVSFAGCDFYYVYGTRYRTTKTNADSVEKKGGIYYHTWKVSPGEEQDIVITQYGLNAILLYVLIISLFVLSLAVIFVIIIYNGRKNKAVFRSVEPEFTVMTEGTDREEGE